MKKSIKEKTFQKRYLKYIEKANDREWFESQFELRDKKYYLRDDFDKKNKGQLKRLFAVVRKNRKGPIRIFPIALTGIVAGGIVIFFTVFANPLLEAAMEAGLEAAFEAKSDVNQLRISLLKFSIAIESITVANRDKPMTNLFEMGKMRIRLKPEAVLRGKIYIEEIRADSIQFGTPRTVSGSLPGKPPKEKKKTKSEMPPLVDLQNFDAMGLLNREFDKLRTPKLYDEAIKAYTDAAGKWKGNVELAKARTEELKASAQPILKLNVNNYKINVNDKESITKTIAEINKTISDINTMITAVQTTANDAANMVKDIENDINTAKKLEQNARTAITDDINHLKSYIDLSSGTAMAALEPSIREILTDTAEEYIDYGLRALELFEKIKAESDAMPKTQKPPKKEPKVVFKGRDVIFPTRAYPTFYLGVLASDFTIQPWNWAFDLRDISTDPDLTNRPVTLKLGMTEQSGNRREITFNGSGDFRSKATDRFTTVLAGSGFPVNFGGNDALSKAGINGFNSGAAFSVNFSGRTDGGISGGGDIKLSNAKLLDPQGTIAQALDEAIRETKNINLGIQYTHRVNADDDFKITTNIADLLAAALKRIVNAYMKKAMDEIERLLREKIAQYIDGRFLAKEDLDALFRLARGDKAAVDDLKNSLNSKKAELEKKAKSFTDQAAQQLKDEANKQAQQAVEDLKKGQTPTLQAPSVPALPGGGGLKLPGR